MGSHYLWKVRKDGEEIAEIEDYANMLRYVRTFPTDELDRITIKRTSPLGESIYNAKELYDRRPW